MSPTGKGGGQPAVLSLGLRVLIAAGLIISAVVHLQLAAGYQQAAPGGIGQGNLFRMHAAVSLVTAVFLLIKRNSPAFLMAALVALSAFAAAILYRYVPVPGIGPIPSMYEPVWFAEKVVATVVEGIAGSAVRRRLSPHSKNRIPLPASSPAPPSSRPGRSL